MLASKNIYRACVYTRLSRDDGDKPESDSIANQKALIRDYLHKHSEIQIVSEHSDDGFSGVNFERPGFKEMMDEIRNGKVDCVVVKDLLHIAPANGRFCGAKRPRCGASGHSFLH